MRPGQKQHYLFLKIVEKVFTKRFQEIQIPENIYLTYLNYDTGVKSTGSEKNTIIEALKFEDINNLENNNLISSNENDKTIQFRQFY